MNFRKKIKVRLPPCSRLCSNAFHEHGYYEKPETESEEKVGTELKKLTRV